MISLQSHNQVLYHLTQLSCAVNPKSTPRPVKIKRQQQEQRCHSTESRSKKNIGSDTRENRSEAYTVVDPTSMATIGARKNNLWIALDQLSTKTTARLERHSKEENYYKWKVSYVARDGNSSFSEKTFPCARPTEPPIVLPAVYLSLKNFKRVARRNLLNFYVQSRSFKTQRNINMEFERNPSFANRLKKWLGQSQIADVAASKSLMRENGNVDIEQVKHLFGGNAKATEEEKKRIRLAFVEGYETGLDRQIRKRLMWIKYIPSILLTLALFSGIWLMGANPGSMYRFSMGQRGEINPETIHVTFNDVKGVEEAEQELRDVVEFLKNPDKFSALGGKLPKGVLLVGPPGTGKTLLARAVAGEAGVPFFHAAGPEFDEVLVGQGARRVRDLFKAAKERAPAVIFIDEIDSVGAKRSTTLYHPYANQTINQLLSEMDGFLRNEGVIVLGATNRRDDLDKALLRPGRFDVEIYINKPDYMGRKEILDLYLSRVLTREVDIDYLARCTSGFTGADIENMINQAALRAAMNNADHVTMKHLEYARDKVIMGPERKLKINDDEGNRITACHEAGHALVAYYTKEAVPIHKVTIIPRGSSLGHTSFMPDKDASHVTKAQLLASMDAMMGGRAAEELIFGPDRVTTGAASDFQQATLVAEQMVKNYGMSEKVGFRSHTESKGRQSIGGGGGGGIASDYGPSTNELIDNEVKRILQESYERAKSILRSHAKEHKHVADALLRYETLNAEDVKAIVKGKKTRIEIASKQPPSMVL